MIPAQLKFWFSAKERRRKGCTFWFELSRIAWGNVHTSTNFGGMDVGFCFISWIILLVSFHAIPTPPFILTYYRGVSFGIVQHSYVSWYPFSSFIHSLIGWKAGSKTIFLPSPSHFSSSPCYCVNVVWEWITSSVVHEYHTGSAVLGSASHALGFQWRWPVPKMHPQKWNE